MLQQNPEPATSRRLTDRLTLGEQKEVKRTARRGRNVMSEIALGMALITAASGFNQDVRANKELQATAVPTVETMFEALEPEHQSNALVFIHGFGTIDADSLAQHVGPAAQQMVDGQVWSVGYNNAHLDERATAHQIIDKAESDGVEQVAIFGYSGGFIFSTKVGRIIADESSLRIGSFTAIAAPDGLDTVREEHVSGVALLKALEVFPDLAYSSPFRKLGELAFRSHQYLSDGQVDLDAFWRTVERVNYVVDSNKLPGTWLMVDQLALIENADIEADLQAINESSPLRLRPTVSYFGTARPGYDAVVDDERAALAICESARKAEIDCYQFYVQGAVHNRVDIGGEAYQQAFTDARPVVAASMARAMSDRHMAIARLQRGTIAGR